MQTVVVESWAVFSGAIHAVQVVCVWWQFQSCGLVRTFSYEAEEKSYEMNFLAFRTMHLFALCSLKVGLRPNGGASLSVSSPSAPRSTSTVCTMC